MIWYAKEVGIRTVRPPATDPRVLEKALRGTTTVGIVTREATILAADKRATAGYYVAHKRVKKIVKIDDYVAMTTAGLVADAQALADYLRTESLYHRLQTGTRMSIRSMANLLGFILNSSKYFPYVVQLLIGGYDTRPQLFAVEWFGDVTEETYTATGSGSPIAIGVIEAGYREDMGIDDAVKLAAKAVASATTRDVFSGEGVDVVAITKDRFLEYHFDSSKLKALLRG